MTKTIPMTALAALLAALPLLLWFGPAGADTCANTELACKCGPLSLAPVARAPRSLVLVERRPMPGGDLRIDIEAPFLRSFGESDVSVVLRAVGHEEQQLDLVGRLERRSRHVYRVTVKDLAPFVDSKKFPVWRVDELSILGDFYCKKRQLRRRSFTLARDASKKMYGFHTPSLWESTRSGRSALPLLTVQIAPNSNADTRKPVVSRIEVEPRVPGGGPQFADCISLELIARDEGSGLDSASMARIGLGRVRDGKHTEVSEGVLPLVKVGDGRYRSQCALSRSTVGTFQVSRIEVSDLAGNTTVLSATSPTQAHYSDAEGATALPAVRINVDSTGKVISLP